MTWCWIIPIIVGLIAALLGYLLGRAGKQSIIDEWMGKYEQENENVKNAQRKLSLLEHDLGKAQESEVKANMAHNELKGRFDLLQHQWDENRTEIQNLKDENETLHRQLADCQKKQSPSEGEKVPGDTRNTATKDTPIQSGDLEREQVFDADAYRSVMGRSIKIDDLTAVEGIGPKIQELFHQKGIKTWYALSQCSVEKCNEILKSGGSRFIQHNPGTWPQQAKLAANGEWEQLKKWQDELQGGV